MGRLVAVFGLAAVLLSSSGCVAFTVARGIMENTGLASGNARTAWKMVDEGALLIDVRSPEEFQSAPLDGAINIPYQVIGEEIGDVAPDKDMGIVVYCLAGHRAAVAEHKLHDLGYTHVFNAGGRAGLARNRS